jgi:ribosomal protein S25
LGNGTVELEKVGDRYEAWISLARNYDVELVKHISDKSNELVEQEIHLNTWILTSPMVETHRILKCYSETVLRHVSPRRVLGMKIHTQKPPIFLRYDLRIKCK